MLYHVSEIIVFVLFLPVFMNIILPLGMLAGWSVWKGLRLCLGNRRPASETAGLTAQSLTAR